jgi:hypothetical protein
MVRANILTRPEFLKPQGVHGGLKEAIEFGLSLNMVVLLCIGPVIIEEEFLNSESSNKTRYIGPPRSSKKNLRRLYNRYIHYHP